MRGAFDEYSGRIYTHPKVSVAVDDGRSYIRRSEARYDVVQASLVDTWAATAAGCRAASASLLHTTCRTSGSGRPLPF